MTQATQQEIEDLYANLLAAIETVFTATAEAEAARSFLSSGVEPLTVTTAQINDLKLGINLLKYEIRQLQNQLDAKNTLLRLMVTS